MKPRLPGRLLITSCVLETAQACTFTTTFFSPTPTQHPAVAMSGTQSQIEKAIGQIQSKNSHPEIDFTQHQLENGYTISTQERVVKEVRLLAFFASEFLNLRFVS